MKKRIFFIAVVLMLAVSFAFSASAASEQDIIDFAKANVPQSYYDIFGVQFEFVLSKCDLTEADCDALLAIAGEVTEKIDFTKGYSLHSYTADEIKYMVEAFGRCAEICGVSYTFRSSSNPVHIGDSACVLSIGGETITVLDGDIISDTAVRMSTDADYTWFAIGALAAALCALAAFGYARKFN